jgi:hypothetical protein
MCVSTELAILAVFARDNTNPLVAPLGEPTDATGRAPSVAMPFLLRLGQ